VVLVVLESTAAIYLRPYRAADDPTPHLTRLSRDALLFEHAYAAYPESVKGMVAWLSARYPAFDTPGARHSGVIRNSLARILSDRGYSTALVHSGRFMYLGMDSLVQAAGFTTLMDAGDIGGNRNSSFGVDDASTVKALLAWVDERREERPFFAAFLPIAGHHPYASTVPGPFAGRGDIDRYRNAIHEGDAALGQLLSGLRQRGLDSNTVVVVFGDHGQAFGQHPGNFAHSLALYEENVGVPLIFSVPGAGAARIARTASLVDVAPTVLERLGVEAPAEVEGASLLRPAPRAARWGGV
jgi:phosphoglycerol transferase MdoB-like AlkP superfamily enzyme